MAVVASGCSTFDPRPYNPTRIHPDGVGIEYKIVKAKKNKCSDPSYTIIGYNPPKVIKDVSGYVCISHAQYQKLYSEYLAYERSKCSPEER